MVMECSRKDLRRNSKWIQISAFPVFGDDQILNFVFLLPKSNYTTFLQPGAEMQGNWSEY